MGGRKRPSSPDHPWRGKALSFEERLSGASSPRRLSVRPPPVASRPLTRRCAIEQARALTPRPPTGLGRDQGDGARVVAWQGSHPFTPSQSPPKCANWLRGADTQAGTFPQVKPTVRLTREFLRNARRFSAGSGFESLMAHQQRAFTSGDASGGPPRVSTCSPLTPHLFTPAPQPPVMWPRCAPCTRPESLMAARDPSGRRSAALTSRPRPALWPRSSGTCAS